MKLVNMKRTTKANKIQDIPSTGEREKYPYGLEITLETESLNKLGISLLDYKIGGEVNIVAKGKVERISQSEELGRDRKTMGIQITHLSLDTGKLDEIKASAEYMVCKRNGGKLFNAEGKFGCLLNGERFYA